MDLLSIMQVLYESEEIKNIPDKWQEILPVICRYKNSLCDVFLYVSGQKNVEIKLAILISQELKIQLLSPDEILSYFSLSSLSFQIKRITDYQEYFRLKEQYMHNYQQIHNMLPTKDINISLEIDKCLKLLNEIFGENLYKECFLKIIATVKG